jgi:hypothetical protein
VVTTVSTAGMGRCGVINAAHVRTGGEKIRKIFQRSWRRDWFRIVHWGFHAEGKSGHRFGITVMVGMAGFGVAVMVRASRAGIAVVSRGDTSGFAVTAVWQRP